MTTPNLGPGSAPVKWSANQFGLATMAEMTEEDWKALLEAVWSTKFDPIGDAFGAFKELVLAVIAAFQGDFEPLNELVEGTINNFLEDIAELQTRVEDIPILGDFFELLTGIPDSNPDDAASWIQGKIDDLLGKHTTVAGDIEELKPQVVRAQNMIAVRSNRGLSEGPDPTAESSFSFETMSLAAHSHSYTATGDNARTTGVTGDSAFEVNASTSRWAYINCWRDDPKSVLSWMSWRNNAVGYFYLEVYAMNEDGSYTWLTRTDNLAGELTTVESWMQFRVPATVITEPGTAIGIKFRSDAPVFVSGIRMRDPLPPWGFRPTAVGGVQAGSDAPATVSTLTMDGVYSPETPFVQFGTDVGQTENPRSFYDDFGKGIQDRFWKKLRGGAASSDITVEGGAAAFGGGASLLFSLQAGIYTRPLLTDRQAIEFTVLDPSGGPACGVFLASNWDMNNFVMLSIEDDRFQLWTGNGTNTANWTPQRTMDISTGSTSVWKVEYNPAASNPAFDPSLAPNTYYVSRGGVILVDWPDVTNIVSHGRGRRFGGMMVTSNVAKSGRIDNYHFYDVVAA